MADRSTDRGGTRPAFPVAVLEKASGKERDQRVRPHLVWPCPGRTCRGLCSEKDWKRAFDEINEFEAQQKDNGVTLVKLFLHITQAEQDERFQHRLNDPWKRWKTGKDDYRNRARRDDYLKAYHEMFERTDTRWAPWRVIDANNKKAARIAALTHIADVLEAAVSMDPLEADPEVVALAKEAFGNG